MSNPPHKTPLFLSVTRLAFATYFIAAFWMSIASATQASQLELIWVVYLLALYFGAEWLYYFFLKQDIDLSYAFPLLFGVYIFNITTLVNGGQEKFAILNRIEHMSSFILITFVVWVFFTKYLPQSVWVEHPYYTALLTLAVTSLAGVLNEHFEVMIDYFFGTKLVGKGLDTQLDLLMNSLGSALFLGAQLLIGKIDDPNKRSASTKST